MLTDVLERKTICAQHVHRSARTLSVKVQTSVRTSLLRNHSRWSVPGALSSRWLARRGVYSAVTDIQYVTTSIRHIYTGCNQACPSKTAFTDGNRHKVFLRAVESPSYYVNEDWTVICWIKVDNSLFSCTFIYKLIFDVIDCHS